jgi:hypothetical protein
LSVYLVKSPTSYQQDDWGGFAKPKTAPNCETCPIPPVQEDELTKSLRVSTPNTLSTASSAWRLNYPLRKSVSRDLARCFIQDLASF